MVFERYTHSVENLNREYSILLLLVLSMNNSIVATLNEQ